MWKRSTRWRNAFRLALLSTIGLGANAMATTVSAATFNRPVASTIVCDAGTCEQSACDPNDPAYRLFAEGDPAQIYSQRDAVDGNGNQYPQGNMPGSNSPAGQGPGGSAGGSGGGFTGFSFAGATPGSSFIAAAPGSYIDNAIVGNQFRFRFDSAYGNPTPDRAEFIYGQCGCFLGTAPGPTLPETNIDFQEFRPYLETALTNRLSMFVETPIRLINPDVNPNAQGISDMQVGFKRAIVQDGCQFLTAQLRTYIPTGETSSGLGTGHFSIEPGLLYLGRYNDRTTTQGEFQVWIPTGDSRATVGNTTENFAGTILRYGVGGGYDLLVRDTCRYRKRLTGVVELVGWSVLDGLVLENGAVAPAETTIVNIKSGLRYTKGKRSIAASYGHALTNDVWYRDIVRLEYRYAF